MTAVSALWIHGQSVINGDLNHDGTLNNSDITNMVSTVLGTKACEYINTGNIDYFKVDNGLIAGEWWFSPNHSLQFNADGSGLDNHSNQFNFKFYPCQGKIVIMDYTGKVTDFYTVLQLSEGAMVLATKQGEIYNCSSSQPTSEKIRIIGMYCDWDANAAVEMVPIYGDEETVWHMVYVDSYGFRLILGANNDSYISNIVVNPESESYNDIKADNGFIYSEKSGWYLMTIKKTNYISGNETYTATFYPPTVRLIGTSLNDNWLEEDAGNFTVPTSRNGEFVSPATKAVWGDGGLRIYAKIPGYDWWKCEFIVGIDGNKISYRGNGMDQDRVTCADNQHVYLNFGNDTGEIK